MSIGNSPEMLSQQILVGKLGVTHLQPWAMSFVGSRALGWCLSSAKGVRLKVVRLHARERTETVQMESNRDTVHDHFSHVQSSKFQSEGLRSQNHVVP